jgi:WD40 repeat protein
MDDFDALLNSRGITQNFGAYVTAAAFSRAGTHAAFALGDGTIRLTDEETWSTIQAHEGAILTLTQDVTPLGFLSGGDDGFLRRHSPESGSTDLQSYGMKWVEHAASFAGPKSVPLIACSAGKLLHLLDADGKKLRSLPHPSTVTGLAFDAKGKRIAASHYNGASLWFTASQSETPRLLEWKGSHTGVTIHPAGDALVTSMQENALHGWTLPEGKHMRMSGYPAKTESFGFTKSGRWLATSGADAIVLWPFFGGGPMGKPPMELAGPDGAFVRRIATHPEHEVAAAGFDSGLTVIADIAKERLLPVCAPGRGAITALAWNHTGSHLALATATGFCAVINFSKS